MTLYELTRQESGIILFTSGEIIVTNWSQCEDDYIPHLSPFGTVMNWPCEGIFDNLQMTDEAAKLDEDDLEGRKMFGYNPYKSDLVDDVRDVLPGKVWINDDGEIETDMEILADEYNDIPALYVKIDGERDPDEITSAHVYTLADGTKVIVPVGWN